MTKTANGTEAVWKITQKIDTKRKLDDENRDIAADISTSISVFPPSDKRDGQREAFQIGSEAQVANSEAKHARVAVTLWFLRGVTNPFGESPRQRPWRDQKNHPTSRRR